MCDHKIIAQKPGEEAKDKRMLSSSKAYQSEKESTAKFMNRSMGRKRRSSSDASYNESNDEESKQVKRSTSRQRGRKAGRSSSRESSSENRPTNNFKTNALEMSIIEEEKKGQDVEMSQDVQSDGSDPDKNIYLFKER